MLTPFTDTHTAGYLPQCPCLTEKAQRGKVTCPKLHSWEIVKVHFMMDMQINSAGTARAPESPL